MISAVQSYMPSASVDHLTDILHARLVNNINHISNSVCVRYDQLLTVYATSQ